MIYNIYPNNYKMSFDFKAFSFIICFDIIMKVTFKIRHSLLV